MIKKILLTALVAVSSIAYSAETVLVAWPFGIGDSTAGYSRMATEEVNKLQNKYTFVFEQRSGAGGTIAAQATLNSKGPAILSTSSAFFVRGSFYPDSYNFADFRPMVVECVAPAVLVSKNYTTLKGLDPNKTYTVATTGIGVTTHLIANEIKKVYPNFKMVPYQSAGAAMKDTVAGTVDFDLAFLGDSKEFRDAKLVTAVAVTGPRTVEGIPPLSSFGVASADKLELPHWIAVTAATDPALVKEWRGYYLKALKTKPALDAMALDHCVPVNYDEKQTEKFYLDQQAYWRTLVNDAKQAQ
jgi:tripartite-type tricarboxylate transporter receptor subunit TctC